MSEWMQIDIRLLPVYGTGGFRRRFPNFAKFLKEIGYSRAVEEEQSLYQLVETLIRIKNDPGIAAGYKEPIVKMEGQFVKIRDLAREELLARRLNELDQTLYQLEDLFKELERELG